MSTAPTADLRRDALACFEASVRAVDPERLVQEHLASRFAGTATGPVWVVAIGKAAAAMARGAESVLGEAIAGGVLVAPQSALGDPIGRLEVYAGGHPIPNAGGVAGAEAVLRLAEGAADGDLLLVLISGGGSALMTLPPDGVGLAEVQSTTDALLRAGADIGELNTVRKHLDRLKGGQLARATAPTPVLALVLSDVVGDPLDVIASGPVSPDPTRFVDAVSILERFDLLESAPASVRRHLTRGLEDSNLETPDEADPCFASVEAVIVGSNVMAAEAARAEAERRGYESVVDSTRVTGEARVVGGELAATAARLANRARLPACRVSAGETTVTVIGRGKGGRNQEVALGAALALDGLAGALVASFGTDGIDGPTDAAGALATGSTVRRARARGLDASAALDDNDAYAFFDALGDLIVTGPTGTNVMDLQLILVRPDALVR